MNPNEFAHSTAYSVQLPYIAGIYPFKHYLNVVFLFHNFLGVLTV